MLYEISDVTVRLGGNVILDHIAMEIKERDKIALVGANGAGKTTLLRLLLGELAPESDDKANVRLRVSRSITIDMLRQIGDIPEEMTVEEYMLAQIPEADLYSKERFYYEMEFDRLFTGFGFTKEQKNKHLFEFSGGEKTKLSFIRVLLAKPDLLLLDEPTNHLDMQTVEWLERYMQTYPKAVVFVSHDRFFLDRVANVTYLLEDKQLKRYAGNYSAYRRQYAKEYALQEKKYRAWQDEMSRLNSLIEKNKSHPTKASFARAKKTQMMRMPKVSRPRGRIGHIFVKPIEPFSLGSKWVYEAQDLKVGYDRKHILTQLSLRVRRGQKIAIIGSNGAGKTTLLRTIAGMMEPLAGKSELGNGIVFGYFDQQTAEFESEETVYEFFQARFGALTEKELKSTLANYLFRNEEVYKKVSDLSGGERARLYLAQLLQSRPNLMLLDEPTNHMDIPTKETLESAFKAYTGTLLFVSHDRYFVSQVADAILLLDEGNVYYYPFGYEHYLTHVNEGDGINRSALVKAKDQALVAGLAAVPKPMRHRLKEINPEVAYVEWRLSHAAKAVTEARLQLDEALLEGNFDKIDQMEDRFTQACLDWYDLYLELE